MKHSEALRIVDRLGLAVQKLRSNHAEMVDGPDPFAAPTGMSAEAETLGELLTPWFFGKKNVLRAVEITQANGYVNPQEFYNLMWIADRDENRTLLGIWSLSYAPEDFEFPPPNTAWIGEGWTPE